MTEEQRIVIEEIYKLWVAVTERNIQRDKDYPYGLGKVWNIEIRA